jgi:predicted flap endonuclease-1-like 5' DNA nuclease
MAALQDIDGIGAASAQKLQEAGVSSTQQLLERGATKQGRDEIAEATGISGKLILTWVNHLDLERVNGIGWQYADLLEAAGVDTVPELAQRNAANLHAALEAANNEKSLVRRMPSAEQVAEWVSAAKSLPRIVSYS